MRNRDYRRFQRELAIERQLVRVERYGFFTQGESKEEKRLRALRWFKHPANCSLACCGNPRRWFGEETLQEKRAETARNWNGQDW